LDAISVLGFILDRAISKSEIDNKSAGKICTLFEQAAKALPDSPEKNEIFAKFHAFKLMLYAEKGFAELQIAMNMALEFVEHFPDAQAKLDALNLVLDFHLADETKAVAITRLFNAISAAKESDTKNAALVVLYCVASKNPDKAPAWVKEDVREKALAAVEKIKDPEFREVIRNVTNQ
jgi:hypothetical protein